MQSATALTVAPTTLSPGPTSMGTASPVIIDASTADAPETTTPSVAIFSPGRTTNTSPTASSAYGDPGFGRTVTHNGDVLGAQMSRARSAAPDWTLRARLEVAAGQNERGDRGSDLERCGRRGTGLTAIGEQRTHTDHR